jgi:hypothetical protein
LLAPVRVYVRDLANRDLLLNVPLRHRLPPVSLVEFVLLALLVGL